MSKGYQLFISPHYIYPHDYSWQNDYTSGGADWVPSLKPYILANQTVIATAHKIASPQTNDLVYQLRQHRKEKVILAGVLSNLCVESQME